MVLGWEFVNPPHGLGHLVRGRSRLSRMAVSHGPTAPAVLEVPYNTNTLKEGPTMRYSPSLKVDLFSSLRISHYHHYHFVQYISTIPHQCSISSHKMGGGQKKVIRGKPPCVHRRRTTATSGTSFPRYANVPSFHHRFLPEIVLPSIEGASLNTTNTNTRYQDVVRPYCPSLLDAILRPLQKPGGLPLKIKRRNSANLQTNLADAIGQLSLYKPKSHRANRPFPASGLSAPPQRFRNNWNRRRNTKAKTTTEGVDKDSELVPDLSDDEVNTKGKLNYC